MENIKILKQMHFVVGEAFGAFKEMKLGGLEKFILKNIN